MDWLWDFLANLDGARVTGAMVAIQHYFNEFSIPEDTLYVIMSLALIMSGTALMMAYMPKLRTWFGDRPMRIEREKAQSERGTEVQVAWIEGELEYGRMTAVEAQQWYFRLAKYFPQLKYAQEAVSLKDRILHEQLNRKRNPDGSVAPLPFPEEKATRKHKYLRRFR